MRSLTAAALLLASLASRPGAGLVENLYPSSAGSEIRLLYADADVIVIDKPANMNTAPGFLDATCAASFVAAVFGLPRVDQMIAHRLDYATSGVVVFARNVDAVAALHRDFRLKETVVKTYVALVHGRVQTFEGEVSLPIGRDHARGSPFFRVNCTHGKPSQTAWRLLEWSDRLSLVHLRPITGRTHQLRLHMLAIGHPIVGDLFYPHIEAPPHVDATVPSRLHLHAASLALAHPRTGAPMRFTAKLPFGL